MLLTNHPWIPRCHCAWATSCTWCAWVRVHRLCGIKPQHVIVLVVPEGKYKCHATSERFAHLLHTSVLGESILIPEDLLVKTACCVRERRLVMKTLPACLRVLDPLSILNVDAPNFAERTGIGAISCDELSYNREWFQRVQGILAAWTEEAVIAHSVRIEVTTGLVALAIALFAFTAVQCIN